MIMIHIGDVIDVYNKKQNPPRAPAGIRIIYIYI